MSTWIYVNIEPYYICMHMYKRYLKVKRVPETMGKFKVNSQNVFLHWKKVFWNQILSVLVLINVVQKTAFFFKKPTESLF